MKTKFITLFITLFLTSNLFGYFSKTYGYEDVLADFTAQNTNKYLKDNLSILDSATLLQKEIISNVDVLVSQNTKENISCNIVSSNFTATIYDIDPKSGSVTCMVAKKGELYAPMGIFYVSYPKMKEAFQKDLLKAKTVNQTAIQNAENQFSSLYAAKKTIFDSMNQQQNSSYLSVPDLLLSTILTDTDIVDVEATNLTNKLQLKNGFTSTIYNADGVSDASNQFIIADMESIFSNFTTISDLSINYLLALVLLFFVFGLVNAGSKKLVSIKEQKAANYSLMPYGFGMFAGLILFFPTTEDLNLNSTTLTNQYELHQNRFMHLSREGYYMASSWASDLTKGIIDNELDMMIDKSGVGTGDVIINSFASRQQMKLVSEYTTALYNNCKSIYEESKMTSEKKDQNFYSNDMNTVFPSSENWAYATSLIRSTAPTDYYNSIDSGGLVKQGGSSETYPAMSMSSCGKLHYQNLNNINLYNDYSKVYTDAIASSSTNNSDKIEAIKTIITFQYSLYRDWGFLSIIGLPIMKMQTEAIGGLYSNPNNKQIDELNDKISDGVVGGIIHNLASSVPYMMIPGISNIYTHVNKTYSDIIAGFDKSLWGKASSFFGGGVATAVIGNGLAFMSSYSIAKTILILLPIVGLLVIGILRFIVIYIKILAFHFAALFIMPVIFAMNNIEAMKGFFMKILTTMLEIPLFVLAVWLAMSANNLIHSVGDIFSKRILVGMIENNATMHTAKDFSFDDLLNLNFAILDTMKIYFIDGLLTIAISLFSVVIIYKIIVNLHTAVFELLETKGTATLDNTIDSMKNEITSHGARI
jgi:hypothetical protein